MTIVILQMVATTKKTTTTTIKTTTITTIKTTTTTIKTTSTIKTIPIFTPTIIVAESQQKQHHISKKNQINKMNK